MEYSQYEYDQHLTHPDWTASETTYLFNLLREYDLRFIVVADRYLFQNARTRTVEVSDLSCSGLMAGNQGPLLCSLSTSDTHEDCK